MLTESEREWLKNRKGKDDRYLFCKHCTAHQKIDDCYWIRAVGACPMYPDIEDAAEFSERVAAKLAQVAAMQKKHHCCVDIDVPFHCPGWQSCAERMMAMKELRPCEFEILKGARIEAEEEMDNG